MKVQVLGDSFALPRTYKNSNEIEIRYEDVYPEQLRQMLKNEYYSEDILLINSSRRFNNSFFLIKNELGELYLNQAEYLVVQVGIVDCWTRDSNMYICEEFKNKNPWINEEEYINFIKSLVDNSKKFIDKLKGIIIINITKTKEEQYRKFLGSHERTKIYNDRLSEFNKIENVYVLDVYSKFQGNEEEFTCSDGVHPSVLGNNLIAKEIFLSINYCEKFYSAKSLFYNKNYQSALSIFSEIYSVI